MNQASYIGTISQIYQLAIGWLCLLPVKQKPAGQTGGCENVDKKGKNLTPGPS